MELESSGIIVTNTASLAVTSSTGVPSPAWIMAPISAIVNACMEAAESAPQLWAAWNRELISVVVLIGLLLTRPDRASSPSGSLSAPDAYPHRQSAGRPHRPA